MVGMKIQEWLDSLRRGRSWEEVGGRKLPYVTIVLKYVLLSSSLFFLALLFFLFLFFGSAKSGKRGTRTEDVGGD
jgi:hypothetical protein